jgi:hypothetical protein
MDANQALALQAFQRGAQVAFINTHGQDQGAMISGHCTAATLLFLRQPGEDTALQAGEALRGHGAPLHAKFSEADRPDCPRLTDRASPLP